MTPRCGVERPKVARLPRSSLIATSQKQCICLRLCLSPYRSDSATAWTHTPGNSLYITEGPSRLTFPFEAHGVCVLILFKQSKGKVGRAEWGHRLDCSRPRYRDRRKQATVAGSSIRESMVIGADRHHTTRPLKSAGGLYNLRELSGAGISRICYRVPYCLPARGLQGPASRRRGGDWSSSAKLPN